MVRSSLSTCHAVVSIYVNLIISRDREEYTAGSWRGNSQPQSEGVRAGSWVPCSEQNIWLPSWCFLRETPLSQLTGLGMNGLVFTQYIRSKRKVCAAARTRNWWLGVTYGGEDALKQTPAPWELWMGPPRTSGPRGPSSAATSRQLSGLGNALHASDTWGVTQILACHLLVKRTVVYKRRLNENKSRSFIWASIARATLSSEFSGS